MVNDIITVLAIWLVVASPLIALIINSSKQEYIGAEAWQKHFDSINQAE